MTPKAWLLAASALLSAGVAQATCYSVYKADGTLLHEGSSTPVNLALPIGDTVPDKFGTGATMTVSDHSVFCKSRGPEAAADKAAPKQDVAQSEAMAIKKVSGR
ncbi:MAG TPA: hypothetical protein VF522_21700 [Ramlibacter sp.]|uniref:hypothetical protein n=1 Tax=Ramlibacter sp. TaxID=1917967 RepID=UPI002ED07114